ARSVFVDYRAWATNVPEEAAAASSSWSRATGAGPVMKSSQALPPGVTTREVSFFSEGVKTYGKLFLPSGFSAASNAAGVVVAPNAGQTALTVESYAAAVAQRGIVAMAIDYRGWGKS